MLSWFERCLRNTGSNPGLTTNFYLCHLPCTVWFTLLFSLNVDLRVWFYGFSGLRNWIWLVKIAFLCALYHKNTKFLIIIYNLSILQCFRRFYFTDLRQPFAQVNGQKRQRTADNHFEKQNYDVLNILNKQSKRVLGTHFMVTGLNLYVIFIWTADFSYRNSPTMSRQQLQPIVSALLDPIPPRLHYSWLRRISVTYARLRDFSGCESQVRVT